MQKFHGHAVQPEAMAEGERARVMRRKKKYPQLKAQQKGAHNGKANEVRSNQTATHGRSGLDV
jgi:hypothetical protein